MTLNALRFTGDFKEYKYFMSITTLGNTYWYYSYSPEEEVGMGYRVEVTRR